MNEDSDRWNDPDRHLAEYGGVSLDRIGLNLFQNRVEPSKDSVSTPLNQGPSGGVFRQIIRRILGRDRGLGILTVEAAVLLEGEILRTIESARECGGMINVEIPPTGLPFNVLRELTRLKLPIPVFAEGSQWTFAEAGEGRPNLTLKEAQRRAESQGVQLAAHSTIQELRRTGLLPANCGHWVHESPESLRGGERVLFESYGDSNLHGALPTFAAQRHADIHTRFELTVTV